MKALKEGFFKHGTIDILDQIFAVGLILGSVGV